jgi:hypothetical protein
MHTVQRVLPHRRARSGNADCRRRQVLHPFMSYVQPAIPTDRRNAISASENVVFAEAAHSLSSANRKTRSGGRSGGHMPGLAPAGSCREAEPSASAHPPGHSRHFGAPSDAPPNARVAAEAVPTYPQSRHSHCRPNGDTPRSTRGYGWAVDRDAPLPRGAARCVLPHRRLRR